MKKLCVSVILAAVVLQSARGAVDLKQSRLTQVVNSVEIISSSARHAAEVNDVFKMPDVMRTGTGARAEMIADDGTITRVGANTIFSFDPAQRTINLDQGSLLFHAPHGKGGGTIRTGSATASVLGTTIIVTSTPNGGFKVLDLEGEAEVRFLNGLKETLTPGQMVFILPGGGASPIVVFRLDVETQGSLLVTGFNDQLPSWPQIEAEITRQLTLLLDDRIVDTDLVVGDNATPQTVQVVMNIQNIENQPALGNSSVIGSDHTPNQPLPVDYAPLNPQFTKTAPFTPPGNFSEGLTFLGLTTPSAGFVGDDIDIDTHRINLAPFSGDSDFDFMAQNNLRIWQSLTFGGEEVAEISGLPATVALFAGDEMEIAQDATLQADTETFGLVAGGFSTLDITDGSISEPGVLDGVTVLNYDGDIKILSQSDLTWDDYGEADAYGDVDISSDGSLTLGYGDSDSVTGDDTSYDFAGYSYDGSIKLTAVDDLNLNNADIDAGEDVCITAGGSIEGIGVYGGDINIEDGSDITAGDYEDVGSGGNVRIYAYDGNVNICDSEINAYSGESITADDSESDNGNVYIYAAGTGDIDYSSIYADNDVGIKSGDSLSIIGDGSEEIDAGGNICLISQDSSVYLDDTLDAGGDVDITSGQSVEPSGDDTESGGIDIEGIDIYAGDSDNGGNVCITANNGGVTINNTGIYAYGDGYSGEGSIYVNADDGNVSISDSDLEADPEGSSGGAVDIMANQDVSIACDTTIDASGNVDICADGSLSATADTTDSSGIGAIDIENSDISAGFCGDEACSSVKLSAYDGGINLYDDDIYAYNDDSSSYMGSVTIKAGDNIIINGGTDIYADGNINISAGSSESVDEDSSEESCAAIDIDCATIYAGDINSYYSDSGGSICITANDGDIDLHDDDIEAYSGEDACGNIKVDSNGNVDINGGTLLQAGGNVFITSGESESVDSDESSSGYGDVSIDCSDIYSGYDQDGDELENVCINAGGNVSIKDGSDVYAYGNVDINAGNDTTAGDCLGNVDVECSSIEAGYDSEYGGDITINANTGNIYLSDSTFTAEADGTEAGTFTATADNNIDVLSSMICAPNGVWLTADNGYVNVYDSYESSDLYVNGWTISAGTYASLGADDCVNIDNNTSIEAYDGDITVTANDGDAKICDSSLVDYDGDIEADAYDGSLKSSDSQYIANGSVCLFANDNVKLDDDLISASSGNTLSGDNEDNSDDKVSITSDESLCITGSGTVNIYDGNSYDYDIGADYKVDLKGEDGVSLDDVVIDTLVDDACDEIKVTSADGNICITDGSDLDSTGSIKIEACDDGVSIIDSTLTAEDGDVSVKADDGMLYIDSDNDFEESTEDSPVDYNIYASDSACLDGNCVTIKDTAISAGDFIVIEAYDGNVKLSDADLVTYSGDVNISSFSGNVTLESGCEDYGVNICAGTDVIIEPTGNACISDADITADMSGEGGNVTVSAGQNIWADSFSMRGDNVYLNAFGNVTIDGGGIMARNGNVEIQSGATEDESGEDFYPSENNSTPAYIGFTPLSIETDSTIDGDDVDIAGDGSEIDLEGDGSSQAYTGNIDIEAGDDVTIDDTTLIGETGDAQIISDNGDVNIEGGSTIQSTDGGVDVTADSGTVMVCGSDLEADAGNVVISADDNVNIGSSILNASQDVSITSYDGMVSIDAGDTTDSTPDVYAGGMVSLTGDCVSVDDTYVYAAGGDIDMTSEDGGVSVSGAELVTYEGNIDLNSDDNIGISSSYLEANGDESINTGGNLAVCDSDISGNNVDMESAGELTVMGSSTISGNYDVTLTSDDSDVDVYDSTITAGGQLVTIDSPYEDGDVYLMDDTINVGSGNDVSDSDISISDDTSICASGEITVTANGGEVYITGDNVNICDTDFNFGGNISISGSTLTADDGDVDITSQGDLVIDYNGTENLNGLSESGDNIIVCDSTITAENGNVNISNGSSGVEDVASDNSINIEDNSYISAYDDVSASTGGDLNVQDGSSVVAGDSVSLNAGDDVLVCDSYIGAEEDVSICAGGELNVEDGSSVVADGSISMNASGDITVSDSYISASQGNTITPDEVSPVSEDTVCISSGGTLTIDGTDGTINESTGYDIGADHKVSLYGDDGVSIDDAVIETLNEDDSCEKIDITSDGDICIDESTLSGNGSIEVVSYDGGNVNINGGTSIEANDGNVTIGSACDTDDVNLDCSEICADGCVNINAYDNVNVYETSIYAYGDVNINADAMNEDTGGMLTIDEDNSFDSIKTAEDSGVDYDISACGSVDLSGDCVTVMETAIYAGGSIDITANDGNVRVTDTDLVTDSDGVSIDAEDGNVTLAEGCDDYGVNICAGTCVDITASGDVCISDTGISADMSDDGGDVRVSAGGNIWADGFGVQGDNVGFKAFNNVTIENGDIMAWDGNVTIESGDSCLEPSEVIPTGEYNGGPDYIGFTQSSVSPDTYNSGDLDPTVIPDVMLTITGSGNSFEYTGSITLEGATCLAVDDQGLIAGSGDVDLTADDGSLDITGNSSVQSTIIQALDGNVNLTSNSGTVSVTDGDLEADDGDVTISAGEDVNIDDSILNASQDVSITSTGGMVSIDADDTSDSTPDVYAGGMVSLTGECVSVDDTYVYAADGDIDVTSTDGGITLGEAELVAYDGNIDLNSDDNIGISSSYLEAEGNVCIVADGDICITGDDSDSQVEADNGNVTVNSQYGNVYVGNTTIEANDDVNISADNTGNVQISDSDITAAYGEANITAAGYLGICDSDLSGNSVSLTSDDCDVDVTSSTITASGQLVTIDAEEGNVDMMDDTVYVSTGNDICENNISISDDTSVCASGGICVADNGGEVDITGDDVNICDTEFDFGGSISISGSTLTADDGDIDITSQETLSINASGTENLNDISAGGGDIMVCGSTLTAEDGNVNISYDLTGYNGVSSDNSITIGGSTLVAEGDDVSTGNINITTPGTITIDDSSDISASEDVNINAGGGVVEDSVSLAVDESDSINGDVNICDSDIYAGVDSSIGGNVTIESDSGNISLNDDQISASGGEDNDGTIYVEAYGNLCVDSSSLCAEGGVTLDADNGDVSVYDSYDSSDLWVCGWLINAGTSVCLTADDNVNVDGATINANGGDVDITSLSSESVTGDDISTYTVSIDDASSITAYGSVNLLNNSGDINIEDGSTLAATTGNFNVTAAGNVDIENSTITVTEPDIDYTTSGGSLEQDSIDIASATGGNINISADGSTTLNNDVFNLGPNINVSEYSLTADTGDVDITAGTFNIDPGTVMTDCTFNPNTGNVVISDSTITSDEGNVNIEAGNNITISGSTISAAADGSDADYSDGNYTDTSIDIVPGYGNINLTAQEGDVTLISSTFNLGGNVNLIDETVSATGGNVDITTGVLSVSAGGTVDITDPEINGGTINIGADSSGGSAISATGDINLTAENVNVADASLTAGNNVDIQADGTVSIASTSTVDTSITANGTAAGDGVTINAQDGLAVSGATISANAASGTITLNNASGPATIENGSQLQAYYLNVNSDDGILIDGAGNNALQGNTVSVTAGSGNSSGGPTLTIQNDNLSSIGSMVVSAHTPVFNADTFNPGSVYNVFSWNGTAYVDDTAHPTIQAGSANFFSSYLGASEIVNTTQLNVTGGTTAVNTPGINVNGIAH
jgi:FecR protein